MADGVKVRAGLIAALTAECVAAPFGVAEIHLFKNNVIPDVDTVIADLVEADFAGYVPISLVFVPPVTYAAPDAIALFQTVIFQSVDPIPQDIYGWYIVTAGAILVAAGLTDISPATLNFLDTLTLFPSMFMRTT